MVRGPVVAQAGVQHPQAADEDPVDPRRRGRAEFPADGVDYALARP